MKGYSAVTDAVIEALVRYGSLTLQELVDYTGTNAESLRSILARMSKPGARTPKRIYVLQYLDFAEGERVYPRPLWALGALENAKKPKRKSQKECAKAFRLRHRTALSPRVDHVTQKKAGMWAGLISRP